MGLMFVEKCKGIRSIIFRSVVTNMDITECKWLAHDGQAPDKE